MPIVIDHLSHTYFDGGVGSKDALKDICLTIHDGEFLSIIGQTGCGKTTLVQHINGLLQPTVGKVIVEGLDTSEKKHRNAIRSLVGMVFQYPEYQLFADTVYEDIAFGPKNMKLASEEISLRISEAMVMVGLNFEAFSQKSPFELSGGEKRRAALAGILAMRPKYLVLDEPMAGLDPMGREQIMSMLSGMREQTGCAIVMVSHSMEDVARYSDRILVMSEGRAIALDTPEKVFSQREMMKRERLSLPAACRLAELLERKGKDVPQNIFLREDLEQWLIRRRNP